MKRGQVIFFPVQRHGFQDGETATISLSDEAIRTTLVEWYARRSSLCGIDVIVEEGAATLRGFVPTARDRARAVEMAWDAGAEEVYDELTFSWPMAA